VNALCPPFPSPCLLSARMQPARGCISQSWSFLSSIASAEAAIYDIEDMLTHVSVSPRRGLVRQRRRSRDQRRLSFPRASAPFIAAPRNQPCPGGEGRVPTPARRGDDVRRLPAPDSNANGLYGSLATCLWHRALRLGVPASECEDCVQEGWLALLETHPDWALNEPRTRAWLLALVRLKAIDVHRGRLRHPSQSLIVLGDISARDYPAEVAADVEDNWNQALLLKLQGALTQLSEVNREIFIRRVHGDVYRHIGNAVGLSAEAVKGRYQRTRRGLQRILARNDASNLGGSLVPLAKSVGRRCRHGDSCVFNKAFVTNDLRPTVAF
jgi:RNA polymerase sigma factor (sigma-70 family)